MIALFQSTVTMSRRPLHSPWVLGMPPEPTKDLQESLSGGWYIESHVTPIQAIVSQKVSGSESGWLAKKLVNPRSTSVTQYQRVSQCHSRCIQSIPDQIGQIHNPAQKSLLVTAGVLLISTYSELTQQDQRLHKVCQFLSLYQFNLFVWFFFIKKDHDFLSVGKSCKTPFFGNPRKISTVF